MRFNYNKYKDEIPGVFFFQPPKGHEIKTSREEIRIVFWLVLLTKKSKMAPKGRLSIVYKNFHDGETFF